MKLLKLLAIAMLVTSYACKKDDFKEDKGKCPVVLSTSPTNSEVNVPNNKVITVTFNEEMNPATITQTSFVLMGANKISGTISYNTSNATMSFVPTSPLAVNTTYTGRVTTAMMDLKGNALQTDFVWTFSTGNILIVAPSIISTDPIDSAVGVALNKMINATFSTPMDSTTISNSSFTLKQGLLSIPGVVTYSNSKAYFSPNNNLLPNTIYTATISNAAKNTAGISMLNDYTWSFTTLPNVAPLVVTTDPLNLATNVALNKVISVDFNQAMTPSSINTLTFTLTLGNVAVLGMVNYTGTKASFTPTVNLFSDTTYTVTITTGAKNIANMPLANNFVWTFKTKSQHGPIAVDLKSIQRFGIMAGVGVSNNAGFSIINNMDVGIYPGVRSSITGFPPATVVNGAIYASDDINPPGIALMLLQAKLDLTAAYLYAESAVFPAPATVSGDQGGLTLTPGIYKSTSTLLIQSGNLTLDAQGDANATWIFQVASGFTTVGGAGGSVILIGGAQAKNVFWQTGSSAVIGDFTSFKGNILALTSITMNSGATVEGRMLVSNGSVVMTNNNIINKP